MEIPTYRELLKLMWFLVWRHVIILMFVSMTVGWGIPVILNNTVSEDSAYLWCVVFWHYTIHFKNSVSETISRVSSHIPT